MLLVPLGLICATLTACLILAWNNKDVLIAILTHSLDISIVEINLLEDTGNSYSAKSNRQRIEQAACCIEGPIFPASPYFRLKPRLLEEWPYEGIALMRVSQDYRSHLGNGACWSVCDNCKFITYHNVIPGFDYQYSQIKAILLDCKTTCYETTQLAEKIYKKTRMPSLILSRSMAKIHLYINNRMVCIADSHDLGFNDFVTLLENSTR